MPHEKHKTKNTSIARSRRKNARASQERARPNRRGKIRPRPGPRRDAPGTVGDVREQRPLVRLLEALEAEKIRFILIGMSAAIAQGVLANTLDVDLWIDLPSRQYMRVLNLARNLGGTIAANTVVYLQDGTPVNFIYEVTGLGSFSSEEKYVTHARIHGFNVPVLRLERIRKSKESVGRDKDKLHVLLIKEFLRCQRKAARRS